MSPSRLVRIALPVAVLLGTGACAYDDSVYGRDPGYPVYGDAGPGIAWGTQPGDLFGQQNVASVQIFYQPLSPYGRWVQTRWGQAFVPNVQRGWRPYTNGRWGPDRFWISNDPWGWATDHYGRWGYDPSFGWVWVPDTVWGPSWTAWREADDVAGWAPIPPGVTWNVGIGFGSGWGWNDWNSWYAPSWVWVPRSHLWTPGFGGAFLPWNQGWNYWNRGRWQHTPVWGWNGGWNPGWGWHQPGWAGGWNRPGWGGGWNNGWNRPGWNNGWNQPRRGQPGSVGDTIGRGMTGRPPAWQDGGRPRQGWGNGWRGGQPGWNGSNPGNGQGWNGGGNRGGWGGGRQPGSVGGAIGGAMGGRPLASADTATPAPRMDTPRYQAPRMETPRYEAPRMPAPQRAPSVSQQISEGIRSQPE